MKKLTLAAAFALAALPAQAAIVVDRSVDAVSLAPGFPASNAAAGQNFLVQFTLPSAATLTGASVYSQGVASLGTGVTIKFRTDVEGAPSSSNLATLGSSLSLIDTNGASSNPGIMQFYASFAPVALAAGTYWFGMGGAGFSDIGWNIDFNNSNGASAWQLSGDSLQFAFGPNATLAFRLYDGAPLTGNVVPEPESWALLVAGFGLMGGVLRRRRQNTATLAA